MKYQLILPFFLILSFWKLDLINAQENDPLQNWLFLEGDEFVFNVPDTPSYQVQPLITDLGTIDFNMCYVESKLNADPNQLYTLGFSDYPANSIHSDSTDKVDAFLQSSLEGALQNLKGKLISKKEITMNAYKGLDFEISFQEEAIVDHFQTYLVKNRLYVLQVITLATEKDNDWLEKFFSSFHLK
ncbi:MAG TPA: hypothetical protein ENI82_03245 [Bacteroidetes bacterium]|nr:hypothetical protein [Bacteroidota bacterium]